VSEPRFLSVEQVEELHRRSLARYGGSTGLRDPGGLESAVFQPQQLYVYGQPDLYDIAAAYAFHIAEAQAYFDGNKRTAAAAALTFLEVNGVRTRAATELLEAAMIQIAKREMTKWGLAERLRELFPA
jgi:death-on-curing protein